ncbi:LacI family DNA-binding transcriptional regulator [Corynebacterium phoceense]|uniref:LacI family DNA-binding transcriptional regulator n=1 Tax=Corynebacterium phoceense TaxID=1686286 RepID=UPI00211BDB13|nr:LacI family DNA-binding transcriptional regulator [Corynebacterium phoceense]MCQ9331797.1 LacI family transcriptional regulator [Corynebacterium phoceense]
MAGATLKSVAQRAGVSVSTASRALSGNTSISAATRANVVAAAKELGYRLNTQARALRRSRTDAIGLIIPSLVTPFFAEMAAAVEEEALHQGFATIISSSAEDADKMVNAALALADRQVDGIIVVPMEGTDAALSTIAASRPLLLLDRQLGELPAIVSSP